MSLHEELRAWVGIVRARWVRLVVLQTAARVSAGAAVILAAGAILARTLGSHGMPLVALAIATGTLAVAVAALAVWLMPRRPSDRQVARFIEERAATLTGRALDDSLVSAIDAAEQATQPAQVPFLPLVLGDAVRKVRALEPSELVPYEEVRGRAVQAAGAGAMLLLALVAVAPSFERAAETARLRLFPGSVRVDVLPGDVRVPVGTSIRIRAALHGTSGVLSRVTPELTVVAHGDRRTVPMAAAGDGFSYLIGSVDRTFSYVVSAGSAQSSRYTVTALTPPHVERIDLHYVYPPFAGLAPRDERDGGDIYAPPGTRVRVSIHTDKPVVRGEIALGHSTALPLSQAGGRAFVTELLLAKDDSYRIRLTDADGLTSSGEAEYFIRLMEDRPPVVRILRPSADQQITPLEEVPIEARADDDYGIARLELVYAVAGGAEHVVPFDRLTGTSIQRIGTRLLPAEELGVKPGDVVTYYARTWDIGRGKRSTEATSDIFFLDVAPFNQEFVPAESQAGAGSADPQLESLIAAQKEIIASTWNVERRSRAGRSADDIKAIAAAQAELKARVNEQLVSRVTRGRGGAPAPERRALPAPQIRRAGDDPVAAAAAAMARAFDALSSEQTKEALPHEMAALNGLLRAQAEVRRRQVTQQANGPGSGGSSRAGQDLSALFDKELQRQQHTNYETRSAAETKPDAADPAANALDRILDLARRQEDLSRRQRELARANLSTEELKRQLERLTREQTELRQQAEELLRANSAGRDPSGRAGSTRQPAGASGSAGNEAAGQLKDAADRMGSAASDMRRDDPAGAARSGEEAAGQLRRLERQLRGQSAGTSARGSSDLKLEAQQAAQEQRRIASEATRLEHSDGAAAADARRRLADEKERLASRVDDLGRSAQQLAQRGNSPDAKALEDSSRDLQRERVADRMRESARQMRQAGAGNGAGAVEQELARALDRVADKLGAGSSALSDQLAQTQAIRDRVQRAEQQLRNAEARARDAARGNGSGSGDARRTQPGRQGSGDGQGADVQRLREEYQRELQRAQDALGRLNAAGSHDGMGTSTPEDQEFSHSAPGTEAFKQDRTGWESLRKNLDLALEKYEASVSDRLSRSRSDQRFSAGGSDRVPDAYGQLIAKYFESLARKKQ